MSINGNMAIVNLFDFVYDLKSSFSSSLFFFIHFSLLVGKIKWNFIKFNNYSIWFWLVFFFFSFIQFYFHLFIIHLFIYIALVNSCIYSKSSLLSVPVNSSRENNFIFFLYFNKFMILNWRLETRKRKLNRNRNKTKKKSRKNLLVFYDFWYGKCTTYNYTKFARKMHVVDNTRKWASNS